MSDTIRVDTTRRILSLAGVEYPCIIGKSGVVDEAAKKEGDGATPLGTYHLLGALLRPDRIATPETRLPWRWLRHSDGWSDDVNDAQYNDAVHWPHDYSAEHLWRTDCCYDVIIVLDHNRNPIRPGAGSAIFWHLKCPDQETTEGCVAIQPEDMLKLLPQLHAGMAFHIEAP